MLYLECSYRYADMTALMCLVTIEMADNVLSAIIDGHLFALCQSYASIAFLWRKSNHDSTSYDKVIFFAKTKNDTCRFWPFRILGTCFPSKCVTMSDGESDTIRCDDFGLPLFAIE